LDRALAHRSPTELPLSGQIEAELVDVNERHVLILQEPLGVIAPGSLLVWRIALLILVGGLLPGNQLNVKIFLESR
jgi:hypothetical protein